MATHKYGVDVVVEKTVPPKDKILKAVKKFWPGLVSDEPAKGCGVLFIYRTRNARAFWNKDPEDRDQIAGDDWAKYDKDLISIHENDKSYVIGIDFEESLKSIAEAIKKG
jgi:hypothetical protein